MRNWFIWRTFVQWHWWKRAHPRRLLCVIKMDPLMNFGANPHLIALIYLVCLHILPFGCYQSGVPNWKPLFINAERLAADIMVRAKEENSVTLRIHRLAWIVTHLPRNHECCLWNIHYPRTAVFACIPWNDKLICPNLFLGKCQHM